MSETNSAIAAAVRVLEDEYDQLVARTAVVEQALTALRPLLADEAPVAPQPTSPLAQVEPAPPARTPPSPTAKPKDGRSGPRTRRYDYAEVARIAIAAHERGEAMSNAIAATFGIEQQSAKDLLKRSRNDGHPIPTPGKGRRPPTPARSEMHDCSQCSSSFFSQAALDRHVERAHADDDADIDRALAARTARPEQPDPEPTVDRNDRAPRVLRCDDCPATFAIADLSHLIRHTIGQHHREPRTVERTPRPKEAA